MIATLKDLRVLVVEGGAVDLVLRDWKISGPGMDRRDLQEPGER